MRRFLLAAIIALAPTGAGAAQYQMTGTPGSLLMPPAHLQRQIIPHLHSAKHKAVPMAELKLMAGHSGVAWDLWGCACKSPIVTLKYGTGILVWDGLNAQDRRAVLIHELAHAMFGWKH